MRIVSAGCLGGHVFEAIVDHAQKTTDDARRTSNDHHSSPYANGLGEPKRKQPLHFKHIR